MRMRNSRDNISEYFSVQESNPVPLEDKEFCAVTFEGLWRRQRYVREDVEFLFSRFQLELIFPILAVLYQVKKFVYNKTDNVRIT